MVEDSYNENIWIWYIFQKLYSFIWSELKNIRWRPWYNFVSMQNNNNVMAENETVLSRGCCLIRRLVGHDGKQSNVVFKNAKNECHALIVIFGGDIQVRNLSLLKYGCAYYFIWLFSRHFLYHRTWKKRWMLTNSFEGSAIGVLKQF